MSSTNKITDKSSKQQHSSSDSLTNDIYEISSTSTLISETTTANVTTGHLKTTNKVTSVQGTNTIQTSIKQTTKESDLITKDLKTTKQPQKFSDTIKVTVPMIENKLSTIKAFSTGKCHDVYYSMFKMKEISSGAKVQFLFLYLKINS